MKYCTYEIYNDFHHYESKCCLSEDIPNIFTDTLENAQDTGRKKKKLFQFLIWQQITMQTIRTIQLLLLMPFEMKICSQEKNINDQSDRRPATIAIGIIEMQKLNRTKCKFLSFARHISSISIWKTILCFFLSFFPCFFFVQTMQNGNEFVLGTYLKVLLPVYCQFALFRVLSNNNFPFATPTIRHIQNSKHSASKIQEFWISKSFPNEKVLFMLFLSLFLLFIIPTAIFFYFLPKELMQITCKNKVKQSIHLLFLLRQNGLLSLQLETLRYEMKYV